METQLQRNISSLRKAAVPGADKRQMPLSLNVGETLGQSRDCGSREIHTPLKGRVASQLQLFPESKGAWLGVGLLIPDCPVQSRILLASEFAISI